MNAKIDIRNVYLKTSRLIIRPWTKNDLDDFYAYAKIEDVGKAAGWRLIQNKEQAKVFLEHFINDHDTLALELENQVIGNLSLRKYPEVIHPKLDKLYGCEIGFALAKEKWGQGLMCEAVKAILEYIFVDLKLDFVIAYRFEDNLRSKRVLEKCGFQEYHEELFNLRPINQHLIEHIIYKNKAE